MENRNLLIILTCENKFFLDFVSYLQFLEKQPIKTTLTGNISLVSIPSLLDNFKQRERFDDYQKYGWKIRTENNLEFLTQIKIIAEVMNLTFKRKREIKLSKNGLGYLHQIDPLIQYLNMVLFYWGRVNWEYFSSSREINGQTVVGVLQKNQKAIWEIILGYGQSWIDFKQFSNNLSTTFDLKKFYTGQFDTEFSYHLDVEYGLLYKNLVRFGCMEIEKEESQSRLEMIVRFKVTPLGQLMFLKAQNTWI